MCLELLQIAATSHVSCQQWMSLACHAAVHDVITILECVKLLTTAVHIFGTCLYGTHCVDNFGTRQTASLQHLNTTLGGITSYSLLHVFHGLSLHGGHPVVSAMVRLKRQEFLEDEL